MSVFVSHTKETQEDRDQLENVRGYLDAQNIPLWMDMQNMVGGADLRKQIIKGVRECDVCVFIATPHSIRSEWCLVEVGAFLGVGKPVIPYRAGVSQDNLPEPLKSDLATGNLASLATSVRKHLEDARSEVDLRTVADLTVARFQEMLFQSAGLNEVVLGQSVVGILLASRAVAGIGGASTETSPARAFCGSLLRNLLRLPNTMVEAEACRIFTRRFSLKCAEVNDGLSEYWDGFAVHVNASEDQISGALLIGVSHQNVASVAVVAELWKEGNQWGVNTILDDGERRPEGTYQLSWHVEGVGS